MTGTLPVEQRQSPESVGLLKTLKVVENSQQIDAHPEQLQWLEKNRAVCVSIRFNAKLQEAFEQGLEADGKSERTKGEDDDCKAIPETANRHHVRKVRELLEDFEEHPVPDLADVWSHHESSGKARESIKNLDWFKVSDGCERKVFGGKSRSKVKVLSMLWELQSSN